MRRPQRDDMQLTWSAQRVWLLAFISEYSFIYLQPSWTWTTWCKDFMKTVPGCRTSATRVMLFQTSMHPPAAAAAAVVEVMWYIQSGDCSSSPCRWRCRQWCTFQFTASPASVRRRQISDCETTTWTDIVLPCACQTLSPAGRLSESQRWSLKVRRPAAARRSPSLLDSPSENI